ncbi:MAG: hypothetical protein RBR67_15580 [Desulfobacterium sp.]|nr:hypothetical protein [Desulfobacterium sp.]
MQIYPGPTDKSRAAINRGTGEILPGKASDVGRFKALLAQSLNTGQSAASPPAPTLSAAAPAASSTLEPSLSSGLAPVPGQALDLVLVGKVTKDVPTVSELLYKTSYRKECWNILANESNADKAFKTIPPGTDIFIDPKTSEIVWGKAGQRHAPIKKTERSDLIPVSGGKKDEPSVFPRTDENGVHSLSAAARKFIGTPYSKMNCYELVVAGLKDMGIQYQGPKGLGGHLIERALGNGLAMNHYLNGEGIMDAAGTTPYERRIFKINNPDLQADKTMAEMAPFLQDGQILSFSTRTRGHTGIVSIKDNAWTFINSGDMDHNLAGANGSMGVGEEALGAEVRNWFRLAAKGGEGLRVSLGSIDMEKLAKFDSGRGGFTEKV